jgi:hypothetical protein
VVLLTHYYDQPSAEAKRRYVPMMIAILDMIHTLDQMPRKIPPDTLL